MKPPCGEAPPPPLSDGSCGLGKVNRTKQKNQKKKRRKKNQKTDQEKTKNQQHMSPYLEKMQQQKKKAQAAEEGSIRRQKREQTQSGRARKRKRRRQTKVAGGSWGVLGRLLGGPLGIFGGSCGVLRAPARHLEGSGGFTGKLLCDLRVCLGDVEGQRMSRKPPKKAPSGDATSCCLEFQRQYKTFP